MFTHAHHIFFIHSSVDGQLSCFCILTIENNAAVNIGVHVVFQIIFLFFSYIYPGVERLGNTVFLIFGFFKESP